MAEVLVIGKKISEMGLVNEITGEEKIPTSALGDKAVTTSQLLTYVNNNGVAQWGRIGGDISNQADLQNQFAQQLATLQNHIQDQDNPHNVTKEQVGLGLADNTADMDKPVSIAVQEALSLKADQTYVDDSLAIKTHNSLLGRDADGAHPAGAILDGSGVTQQQINDLTGVPYRVKAGGYNIGERVVLENGDIVQSVVAGNTVDPSVDMTGWVGYGLAIYSVDNFGAKGDGITFDHAAINSAITKLSSMFKTDGLPRFLNFTSGKTYVCRNVNMKPGVSLGCINGYAKLLRTPNSNGEAESSAKWWRILQTSNADWVTDADFECRNYIHNLILDGNYLNTGWTFGTYSQEQASCLIINGRNNVDAAWKRVRFNLSNLIFMNSTSDGLHVVNDADVTFHNLQAERCFRGGLVITGGNSVVRGSQMVSNDARTDIEIDSGGFGQTFKSYVYISDFYQDVGNTKPRLFGGGFDLGTIGGGVMHLNNMNVHSAPLNCYFAKSNNEIPEKYLVENSVFHVTGGGWYNPTECTFRSTKFVFRNDINANARISVYGAYSGYTQDSEVELLFDGCDFELFDKNIERTTTNFRIESQNKSSKAWVRFKGCDFSGTASTSYDIWGDIGGRFWVEDTTLASTSSFGGAGTMSGYPLCFKIGKNKYLPSVQKFLSLAYNEHSQEGNSVEFLDGCVIPQSINSRNSFAGQNQVPPIRIGKRIIRGDAAPTTSTAGYNGDTYELVNVESGKPFRWVCVSPKVSYSGVVWQPIDIPQLSASVTYNPPPIAESSSVTTTVTLPNAPVGGVVQAAFSQYNADIEISAVVSAENTVTVKFKNIGSTPVDLPSGNLIVKLV